MITIPCSADASTSLNIERSLTRAGEVWVALSEGDSLVYQARVSADALRAALDEVAPEDTVAGLNDRVRRALGLALDEIESPDLMDGGVACAAIEKEAEEAVDPEGDAAFWRARAEQSECPNPDAHHERFISPLAVERLNKLRDALDSRIYRLKRAEKERDQYRADVLNEERISEGYAKRAKEHAATIKEQAALIEALRAEQSRPLTTREHLDAAWEAAPKPAADDLRKPRAIPAGTPMLVRTVPTGDIAMAVAGSKGAAGATWLGDSMVWERRLLDTPEPARDPEAEKFDPIIDAAIRGHSDITSPDVVHAIADALAEEGVRMTEDES